jgi:hypothetical protein
MRQAGGSQMRALCRKGRAAASPVRPPITTSPTLLFGPRKMIRHEPSLPSFLARRSGGSPPCAFLDGGPRRGRPLAARPTPFKQHACTCGRSRTHWKLPSRSSRANPLRQGERRGARGRPTLVFQLRRGKTRRRGRLKSRLGARISLVQPLEFHPLQKRFKAKCLHLGTKYVFWDM